MDNEALRLADELDCASREDAPVHTAAIELRRLHEVNAELVEALKRMTDVFLDIDGNHGQIEQEAMDKAYAALAKT
jgi:hypothetical protein